jgi:MFS family permease
MIDVTATAPEVTPDRPLRTLAAISAAHWVSHFHIFVLPMLFPFLKAKLGVGFVELGFPLTVFAVVSGLTQAPTGYLVDRIGARGILVLGMVLGGAALIVLGLHLNYPMLVGCAALLGIANSVYHPADYAILAAHMNERRMGRAFSVHTFAGFLGGAVAPAIVAALVALIGGQGALIAAGAIGIAVAFALVGLRIPDAGGALPPATRADRDRANANVMTPAMMVLAVFFLLLSLSSGGINSFGVVALMAGYGSSFSAANLALTAFLGASAAGVLAGGFLADRTAHHGQVASACFALNAVIVVAIALLTPSPFVLLLAMTTAGFLSGVIAPSRDMMVRNAAPASAAGRAFGIVSTGFNVGGIISPLLFGWIMDQHMPRWVFGASAAFMALTVLLALVPERKPRAAKPDVIGISPS